MKSIFKKVCLLIVMMAAFNVQHVQASSTVYFFVDFRFWDAWYQFSVNGEDAFKLTADVSMSPGANGLPLYKKMARKVVFENPGSYVIAARNEGAMRSYHAEINLNLEDGETYYVMINASLGKTFYIKVLDENKGTKLLKEAQTSKKYTYNEDFIYTGK